MRADYFAVSITTAPEMELFAATQALRSLDGGHHIKLKSDSEYLVRGMQSLALRWKRHGWRNGRGLLLKDWRLWEELLELEKAHRIDWQPSHLTIPGIWYG
jgi:ribonuclease HI